MSTDAGGSAGTRLKSAAATRLYFIVARKAPMAVVFRRGPSREVELLTWDLESDRLTAGQWLKGRIYERRCDLSPSGQLLVYFAGKYETELRTWTAVSRPPYLTALALWPKGDAWGGGGLFESERRLWLNHRSSEMQLMEGFSLPAGMKVDPFGDRPGWGEDDPIHHYRLERDGWRLVDEPSVETMHDIGEPYFFTFEPPLRYRRALRGGVSLEMAIEAMGEREGTAYVTRYRLLADGEVIRELGRYDWVDAAPGDGGLLLARDGRLLRMHAATADAWRGADPEEVADLRPRRFESRRAPVGAVAWP